MTYQYEPRLILTDPAKSNGHAPHEQWTRPDFYLPDHRSVIEYAGRMDLADYRQRHDEKTRLYELNGFRCYEVFPEDLRRPHWDARLLDAIIEASWKPQPATEQPRAHRTFYKVGTSRVPTWHPTSSYWPRTG